MHQFSSNQVIVDQLSVVEKIDKQPREYRSEQSLASTTNGSASTTNNTELINIPPTQDIYVIYRLRGPDEKNCAQGLENGPSPKGEGRFQDRGHSFSHPDRSCW